MVDAVLLVFQIIVPLIFFIPACVMLYLRVTGHPIYKDLTLEDKEMVKLTTIYAFIAGIIMSFVLGWAFNEL
jgi:hypothetical protein